ncbi:MAG: winged helix-turn-helix transcriptional regulator [Nanoarchaeota archaeon]|nr:winged helix-turn-helix transcriptional regulator [Nanoarchaeota archaeon]
MTKKNSIITEKDILILKQLLLDGRKSSSSISKEIDLGREIVNYRIKRLIKENLIVKFVPKINEKAINYQEYIILLKLNLEDELSKDQFIKQTIGNKYLVWTTKSDSGWDLIVRLYAQSIEEFKEKMQEILDLFSDVLANYYTIISSDEIKEEEKQNITRNLFDEIDQAPEKDFKKIKDSPQILLDTKDKEILKLLESDGRIQYKEIAEELDISSDTVKYRIDKMISQGAIENFMPIINFNKLGLMHYVGIIEFTYLNVKEEIEINEKIKENPFVIKAIKSLSKSEYFLTLLFEKEYQVEAFKEEIQEIFKNKIKTFECFSIE